MNRTDNKTQLLEQLLDRYKFTRPVPEDVREEILSSKKKNLVRVLKTVGAFSVAYGALLSVYFAIKKLGVAIPVAKFIISGITVAAVCYGGYYTVTTLTSADAPATPAVEEKPRPPEEKLSNYKWVDQITLYSGRIIEGAVISRGAQYKVLTASGVMYIPRNKIKMIKPLKTGTDTGTGPPKPNDAVTRPR